MSQNKHLTRCLSPCEPKLSDDHWFGKIAAESLGAIIALLLAA